MSDSLIGPKPEGPAFPTPWQASNWGNLEDASGYTLYFAANGVPLEESKKLGPAIVDAVNAYYGGTGPLQDTWVKACRDLDAKDARIADLEDQLEFYRNRTESDDAQIDYWKKSYRGEYQRAEKAEARVRELEAENARLWDNLADRDSELDDTKDTFTAPDGRVFRVGQRVKDSMKPERVGTTRKFDLLSPGGQTPVVIRMDDGSKPHYNPEYLRRVWDGSEEPDVPVGTVIRGADGLYLRRGEADFWSLWHSGTARWGSTLPWEDWDHGEDILPYVEWLPEDD